MDLGVISVVTVNPALWSRGILVERGLGGFVVFGEEFKQEVEDGLILLASGAGEAGEDNGY